MVGKNLSELAATAAIAVVLLQVSPPPIARSLGSTLTSLTQDIPPPVIVLAEDLPGPDDLLLAPDGSIYISDVRDGTVKRFTGPGEIMPVVAGLNEPEGMVMLPDGSLVIVEQGKNRLVRYDLATKRLTTFMNLDNRTRWPGVDNITLDSRPQNEITIIIPDSPNGRILRVSLDGKTVTEIARGFVRPTGAWVEADGSILVVDEFGLTLKRIRGSGKLELLGILPIPDDVVADGAGDIFVITLGDGAIHRMAAFAKTHSVLLRGLSNPQGIIFDRDGNLVVTDPGHHRLVKVLIGPGISGHTPESPRSLPTIGTGRALLTNAVGRWSFSPTSWCSLGISLDTH